MEAEHCTARVSALSRNWADITDAAASGTTALQASPDTDVYSNTTDSPRADFQVNFTQTGTYYLWARLTGPSSSSDSIHVGFKSVMLTTAGGLTSGGSSGYYWDNTEGAARITFNVTTPGIHTVNLWMREDGVIVDKLVLTQDSAFTPSSTGPAESERVERPVISSPASASGSAGTLFTYRIAAPQPIDTYAAAGLPAGLMLDPATGEIEGRPTATGTFAATITATNRAGSDTNALSITISAPPSPVATKTALESAIAAATPGTVIVLSDTGTWANLSTLTIDCDGTAAAPIHVRAHTPGGVAFTGNVQVAISGDHVVFEGVRFTNGTPKASYGGIYVTGSHVRVTDCAFTDFDYAGRNWIVLHDGQYNRVDHCHFEGKSGGGRMLEIVRTDTAPEYHRIDRNRFFDYAYGAGANGYETIRIGTSGQSQGSSASVVELNYFEGCDGETELISSKAADNVFRQNTIIDCRGALTLRQGKRALVEGNFIHSPTGRTDVSGIRVCDADHIIRDNYVSGVRTTSGHLGGIALIASERDPAAAGNPPADDHWPVRNLLVADNTLYDCRQSFVHGGGYAYGPPSATFVGNLAHNASAYPVVRQIKPIASPSYSDEYYHGSSVGLSPVPAGVTTGSTSPTSTVINGYTLWFSSAAGAPAAALRPLQASDVGPRGYVP